MYYFVIKMKITFLMYPVLASAVLFSGCRSRDAVRTVRVFPASVVSEIPNHPVGINLDFFMDGGRFPGATRSTTEAVMEMGMKYLRYPGGEKSDLYLFSRPPYREADPAPARSGGLQDYPGMFTPEMEFVYDPLDFDEYMEMCREAGAEPVVVVAADNYLIPLEEGEWVTPREELIRHAAEFVRYANITKGYGVKYWMIGNESWNRNNVNSTPEIYARDVIEFSRAMKAVDPSILVIANGDSDSFLKTVITVAGDHIDRITCSNYGVYHFTRGYRTYRDTAQVLIRPALEALRAMNRYATPDQLERFRLIVAEFGAIDWYENWHWHNDMGHAIVTFDMAGQLLTTPGVEFSCFWNTRWIENETRRLDHDAIDMDGNLNPTGRALSIWGNFLGTRMVRTESTGMVLAYASVDPGTRTLYTYLVNKGENSEKVLFRVEGDRKAAGMEKWEFYGKSSEDLYPQWRRKKRMRADRPLKLKGTSITVVRMHLDQVNYYFDPVSGNDSTNSGTSVSFPFRSLEKIRNLDLFPGDSILLKSGEVFSGRLYISCKGAPGEPVVLGRYGNGGKPHIRAEGRQNEAVHVFNSEHMVVRDLEISNRGPEPVDGINGLLVEIKDYGTARDITIDNLYVHDVYGRLVQEDSGGGNAILLKNFEDGDTLSCSSRFDGLTIRNCHIRDCRRNGIVMWGNWIRSKWNPSLNVVFRNNLLEGVPGNGIVPVGCESPLVEYNVMRDCPLILPPSEACDGIWPWSCDSAVVQYNVVSGHRSRVDGYGFDSDWNSTNSIFQYNLSYNNDGGFLLICNSGGWPEDWSLGNRGTRVRYNVSINDGIRDYIVEGAGDYFSPVIHITGPTFDTRIEKNLFLLPAKEHPGTDRTLVSLTDWSGYPDSTCFIDNYIFVEEAYRAVELTGSTRSHFCRNLYSGPLQHPTKGFAPAEGAFDSSLWYDSSDSCWNNLIGFLKDKKIPLGGEERDVLGMVLSTMKAGTIPIRNRNRHQNRAG